MPEPRSRVEVPADARDIAGDFAHRHLVEVRLSDTDAMGHVNNRDLTDFSVDVERTYELLSDVPAGKTVVSESGFHTREQVDELERVGVDAVLIGESLMRAADPEAALRDLGTHGGAAADEPL